MEQLRKEAPAGQNIAIVSSVDGLIAATADGKWQKLLLPDDAEEITQVTVDGRGSAVWLTRLVGREFMFSVIE